MVFRRRGTGPFSGPVEPEVVADLTGLGSTDVTFVPLEESADDPGETGPKDLRNTGRRVG